MAPTLTFKWNSTSNERKSISIYSTNLQRTWEKLLLADRAMAADENSADVSGISSSNTGQWAALRFGPAVEPLLLLGTSLLETSLTRSRHLSKSHSFWWLLTQGWRPACTEASYVNLPSAVLCNTDSTLSYVDYAILYNKWSHTVGLFSGHWPGKSFTCMAPPPMNTHGGVIWSLLLQRFWRWKRKAGYCWAGCDQGRLSG